MPCHAMPCVVLRPSGWLPLRAVVEIGMYKLLGGAGVKMGCLVALRTHETMFGGAGLDKLADQEEVLVC
jgi:hypothetical protein